MDFKLIIFLIPVILGIITFNLKGKRKYYLMQVAYLIYIFEVLLIYRINDYNMLVNICGLINRPELWKNIPIDQIPVQNFNAAIVIMLVLIFMVIISTGLVFQRVVENGVEKKEEEKKK